MSAAYWPRPAPLARQLALLLQRRPRQVGMVLAVALMGGLGSLAIAALGPDPSRLPVHELVQPVEPHGRITPEDGAALVLLRSDGTRPSDTAEALLRRLGVDDPQAAAFLRADPLFRNAVLGRAGRRLTVEATSDGRLQRLVARWAPEDNGEFRRLVVERGTAGFTSRQETARLTASVRMAGGTIRSSLFAATDEAGLPDAIAVQIAEVFSGDIDFHRALRRGDRFGVVYETLEADGEPLRTGRVLATEFVNNGRTHRAVWFEEPGQRGGYYTPDGQSLRRAYLASPMEFSRVTSGFKMRFHPILQQWRAHLGVDYAAPTGTPVRAVGDGVVSFAGWQGGYGNVVILQHRNNHSTLYAHLSRILVRQGQSVTQGQHVGAVGATGWATGPHLHFEFRVAGQHQDPMTIARQAETVPVSAAARPAFLQVAGQAQQMLAAAASLQLASAQ